MTALTVVTDNRPPAQQHQMPDLERMAIAFARSGLFGAKTPEQALALCLVAQAEGKHPAIAAKTYHIINGNPSKKSEAMLVDFLAAGGRVEWHALTDDVADATFSHPQGGSVRITWDQARVNQAQLTGNPMHKKYPRAMKRARCISEGVRTVFPGATGGFYAPEEIQDGGVPTYAVTETPRLTGAALLEQASDTPAAPAADPSGNTGSFTQSAAEPGPAAGEVPAVVTEFVDSVIADIQACETVSDLAELRNLRKIDTKLARYPKQLADLLALINDRRAAIEASDEGAP